MCTYMAQSMRYSCNQLSLSYKLKQHQYKKLYINTISKLYKVKYRIVMRFYHYYHFQIVKISI